MVWYLKEAVPLFVLGTAILFMLDRIGALSAITKGVRPVVSGFLGLPADAAQVFVMGFFRRDYGAAGLYQLQKGGQLSPHQLLIALVVITLFVPCIAQFMIMVKERGIAVASAIGAFVFTFAFVGGGVLHWLLLWFRIVV